MADFPLASTGFLTEVVTSSVVSANATPNVKGSYAELCTSTPWDADGIMVQLQINNTTVSALMDFAVGGSGSEVNVMSDVLIQNATRLSTYVFIPCSIPAGTRISARAQATTGSQAIAVQAHIYRNGFWGTPPGGRIVSMGINSADSGATGMDAGAVADTYTSWVEISSSVPGDLAGIYLLLGNQQNSSPTDQAGSFLLQLGTGGSGSESVVWGAIRFGSGATGGFYGPLPAAWFPVSIPAGSRLSARTRGSTTDATDRKYDIAVYGLIL